jgi:hypothetical protein
MAVGARSTVAASSNELESQLPHKIANVIFSLVIVNDFVGSFLNYAINIEPPWQVSFRHARNSVAMGARSTVAATTAKVNSRTSSST